LIEFAVRARLDLKAAGRDPREMRRGPLVNERNRLFSIIDVPALRSSNTQDRHFPLFLFLAA
jgi:hypothetical protein